MGKTVMIFGLGDLGGWVLEFLARCEGVSTIITADIREDWGAMKTNCAALGSIAQGYSKTIKFQKCDVRDTDGTAELLKAISPDLVYSNVALLTFGRTLSLPADVFKKWESLGGGGRLPFHLTLSSKVMRAVKKSGIAARVVQNSFPDVVNPVLWRNGLGPDVGAGNIALLTEEIKRKVSVAENVPAGEITVCLIGPHSLYTYGTRTGVGYYGVETTSAVKGARTGIPLFFKILVRDKDITSRVDVDSLISDRLVRYNAKTRALVGMPYQAADTVKNIMAILNDTNEYTHAPSPSGLPGGYPVRLNAKGAEVVLPDGITLEEAIRINTEGLKWDGVEEIKDDGTVVLTEKVYKTQRELLGLDYREIRLAEIDDVAKELLAAYQSLAEKYGVY